MENLSPKISHIKDNEIDKLYIQYHLIENINDIVYITAENYNIKFVNNAFRKCYKYSDNEIIGKKSTVLWKNEDDYKISIEKLHKENLGTFYHKRKDNTYFFIEISRSFIKDKEGNVTDIVNIGRDITDKIDYEKQIIQERDLAQSYLNIADVAILTFDTEANVKLINKKGLEILKCTKEDIIGKNWFDNFVIAPKREEQKRDYIEVMGIPIDHKSYYESYVTTKNGDEIIIGWHTSLLKDDNGNVTGMLAYGDDATQRKEIDRMKTEFVNTVSHEIRTPITIVLALIQLLISKENLEREKVKKYYDTMYKETRRLSDLVNDFLDIQKIESGRHAFIKDKMSVLDVIDEVIELYEISGEYNIILDLDKGHYSDIYGDYLKMKQLITNLVSNAIKYSAHYDEITIKLREKDGFIYVSVIDKGLGIPQESIPMLFTKFYRVDSSDHRKVGGTGLGLVICKEIIMAHGGDIGVNSKFGEGSEFYFFVPVIKDNSNN
jgi:PAS domain S-box-containing protein